MRVRRLTTLAIAISTVGACTKTGVIARDRTLITPAVPEPKDESSFLVGSQFTFHAGVVDKCRTKEETVSRDMFGDEDTVPTYEESECNERPAALDVTCTGAPCEVQHNHAADVIVVATGSGTLAVDARVVGADGKERAKQQLSYSIVVPDELRWYADTPPVGPVDATGCLAGIAGPEEFPNGAELRSHGVPVRFPRPDTAPEVTAHACLRRVDTGAAPKCWDIALDDRGALPIPIAVELEAGGHGSYEATVEYHSLTVRCATEYR